ncbi:MAG: AmmeMemoRadiSam system protein A [Atopobiaceae bacterium]|jgi:AmmeMemoRadiSam system protein A|nr:AmmeMemoRadiSam system protein A [Atopobiaceae bacterium]
MPILAAYAVPHPPLIIPGVDPGSEKKIQATVDAYNEVGRRVAALRPETLVISTPHSVMYLDYNHISPGAHAEGSFAQFGDPDDRCSADYDQEFVHALCKSAKEVGLSAGTQGERDPSLDHATMIPLYFIKKNWPSEYPFPRIVRIGLSGLSPAVHYQLGQLVQKVARSLGRNIVYIASGDLSHKLKQSGPYGFAPEGPKFDEVIKKAFQGGDFLQVLTIDQGFAERAAECGLRSFQIMAGALDRTAIKPELLSMEGPYGVGYGVACFTPVGQEGKDQTRNYLEQYRRWDTHKLAQLREGEDALVRLARASLESYVRTRKRLQVSPSDLKEALYPDGATDKKSNAAIDTLFTTSAGCFVSLKKDGELRGCIGTIMAAQKNLAEEICENAISAGTRDPRFPPVSKDELPKIVYDVDVLSRPEPIETVGDLDPKRYGVIVSTDDGRRGLLLPDLDGIDSVQQQLDIAARKGGIDLARDTVRLERFEVVRHT